MTESEQFDAWFQSAPHRRKYTPDHPVYLAAEEAWQARAAIVPARAEPKLFAYGTHPTQVVKLQQAAPPADSARADRIMELVRRYGSICAVHQKAASEGLNPTGVNVNEAYAALEREVRKP